MSDVSFGERNKIHICVVSPGYPYKQHPQYEFVAQLCRALADAGHRITVIAPQSLSKSFVRGVSLAPRFRTERTKNGNEITIYSPGFISVGNLPFIGNRINLSSFSSAVKRIFRKLPQAPDICYGHFWHTAYAAYPIASSAGIPLFVASGEAEVELHKYIKSNKLHPFSEYVRGIICVSTKNLHESIDAGLTTAEKCTVIPNAIDDTLFYKKDKSDLRSSFGFADSDFIVAFVGGFIHRKGSRRVSEAITMLDDPQIKSIFIGSEQDSDRCEPECRGILFKGKLPHCSIPDYLNCADVFVMPTLHEGCCNAVIEAMACGLPIISSDRPFNHDILDSSCAVLIDPMNVRDIADAIRQLKNDPRRRQRLCENALKRASGLTIGKRAEKIIEFISCKMNGRV